MEGAPVDERALVDRTPAAESEPLEGVEKKFFVLKSLTTEDLEQSVHTGVWITQAHNEAALDKGIPGNLHCKIALRSSRK